MDSYRPSLWNSIPPVVKNIIIINVILFLATIAAARWGINLYSVLGLHFWTAESFNVIQLITSMFMHGGYMHILFNMFGVFMLGSVLEQTWGSRRFLLYYMVTGIGAGIIQEVVWTIQFRDIIFGNYQYVIQGAERMTVDAFLNRLVVVGASGAVFGILLAFGMMFPNAPLYFMFIPVPIKAKYFVIGYGILSLYLGFANHAGDNIAHFAHLGGMLFGIFLILYWKKKGTLFG